jgi:hypothetical protein
MKMIMHQMILTGANRVTWIWTGSSATLPTTQLLQTGLGMNPGRWGKSLATDNLKRGAVWDMNVVNFNFYLTENTVRLGYEYQPVTAD